MGGSNPLMLLSELKEGVKPIDRLVFLNSIVSIEGGFQLARRINGLRSAFVVGLKFGNAAILTPTLY